MTYARLIAGEWVLADGPFTVGDGDDAIQYPAGWLDGADDETLAAFGATLVVVEPDPPGIPVIGYELVDVAGVPHSRAIVPPLADLRAARLADLAALCRVQRQAMSWNGATWPCDFETVISVSLWRAVPGVPVRVLTDVDGDAFLAASNSQVCACFAREAAIAAEIARAADVAALVAIDITADWPPA